MEHEKQNQNKKELSAICGKIPTEQAQQIIEAAAAISGKPAADLTIESAIQILGGENPNPVINDQLDRIAEEAVERLFEKISEDEWKQLQEAAEAGQLEHSILSVVEALTQRMNEPTTDLEAATAIITKSIKEAVQPGGIIQEVIHQGVEAARMAMSDVVEFINSDAYKAIKESIYTVTAFVDEHLEEFAALEGVGEKTQNLFPFIRMELEASKKDPDFENCTLSDILTQGTDEHGNPTESKFGQLIERAMQRLEDYENAEKEIEEIEAAVKELPKVIANPTEKLNYPLDKPNNIIWRIIADTAKSSPDGQMKFAIDTSKKGENKNAVVLCSINFDELAEDVKITKQLTQFDKRVYIAAAALYNEGNEVITATQVYRMMGNRARPSPADVQKVNDSITKMGATRIFIDNAKEVQHSKGYKLFKYDSALLQFERITAYVNGQLTESAIKLFREPPLISFARERNQITTISRQLLESPVSKTNASLVIEDYLLERIGRMKGGRGKAPRKILFTTMYDRCNITSARERKRAQEKVYRYLDHYQKCEWVKGYKEESDGITILL